MALSTAARVFNITELCEKILSFVDGEGVVETLFAVQRVSTKFRDVIQGSSTLHIKLDLQYEHDDDALTTATASSAMCALKDKLSISPFYVEWTQTLGAGTRIWPGTESYRTDANNLAPEIWKYNIDTCGWGEKTGLRGRLVIHASEAASWRDIKLFCRPQSLSIVVAVRIGQVSNYTTDHLLDCFASAMARQQLSRANARENSTWRSEQTPRYIETIRFTSEQATLGNLVTTLEGILRRTNYTHEQLSKNPGHISRRFQEPDGLAIGGAKQAWPGMRAWIARNQRLLRSDEVDDLSDEMRLAIAMSMSMEDA